MIEIEPDFPLIAELPEIQAEWDIYNNDQMVARTQYYNYYYSYGKVWKPKRVFEIGVRFGYSALAMCIGAKAEEFVGVDNQYWTSSNRIAEGILRRYLPGLKITLLNLNTQKDPLPDIGKFDLLHLDGDHSEQGVRSDLGLATSIASNGAHIVIEDCNTPKVRRVLEDHGGTYLPNFTGHGILSIN